MTDPVALTRHSTATYIYTVCNSYQQLSRHRSLRSVRNLLRCINAYNNTHHIYNTALAFDQHRALTLDGQIHKRARLFVVQPIRSAPSVSAPLPEATFHDNNSHDDDSRDNEISRLIYEQQITLSMHSSSLNIDKRCSLRSASSVIKHSTSFSTAATKHRGQMGLCCSSRASSYKPRWTSAATL